MDSMEEALLCSREAKNIRCELCPWMCLIQDGASGYCEVRINKRGILYSKNFGKITSMEIGVVEKIPLFHFYPGSQTLTISSFGNTFKKDFFLPPEEKVKKSEIDTYTPESIIKLANDKRIKIISFNGLEPTVHFEFAYRTARLANRYNIKSVFITNGYITSDAIKKIGKYLDVASVHLTASGDPNFYKKYMEVREVGPIFDALRSFKKHRVSLEISNLIIPQLGDDSELNHKLVEWIINNLHPGVPYHLTRFEGNRPELDAPPTPPEILERFIIDARRAGLRYAYIADSWGSEFDNTYCYNCGEIAIQRTGFLVNKINLKGNRCLNCGFKIDVII